MALDPQMWWALAFLMTGIFLIFFEIFQPGFFVAVPGGAFALGGAIAIAWPNLMFGPAGWVMWPAVLGIATVANIWAYKKWAPAGDKPLTMVADSLAGESGVVETKVVEGEITGKVRVKGTVWSARSETGTIEKGAKVTVTRSEGVHVVVEKA